MLSRQGNSAPVIDLLLLTVGRLVEVMHCGDQFTLIRDHRDATQDFGIRAYGHTKPSDVGCAWVAGQDGAISSAGGC